MIDQCSLHTKLAEALDASVAQDATKPGDSAEDGTFDPTKSSASNASAASDVSVALTRSFKVRPVTGDPGVRPHAGQRAVQVPPDVLAVSDLVRRDHSRATARRRSFT